MFPQFDPVRSELINIGAIFEEMCNVISFPTVVAHLPLYLMMCCMSLSLSTVS